MKKFSTLVLTLGILMAASAQVEAKGCIKGAAVGGVAGHVAHHHGVLGAAAGCAVGHHEANKKQANDDNKTAQKH